MLTHILGSDGKKATSSLWGYPLFPCSFTHLCLFIGEKVTLPGHDETKKTFSVKSFRFMNSSFLHLQTHLPRMGSLVNRLSTH